MLKAFALTGALIFILGCADGPPPEEAAVTETPPPSATDTVVQDQIEYTREQTPEAPVEDAPTPEIVEAPRPVVAPPPPTNAKPAPITAEPREAAVQTMGPSHEPWTNLLSRYVSAEGQVDYSGFKTDMKGLDDYLASLAQKVPGPDWSRREALAYWINAYNAFTVKLILDNWPLNSIREIDQPWDTRFITLEGQQYSLNEIEHEIIRKEFDEPRIHFALVCAAASCPPLATQAYTAKNLDDMLERRTRAFINNEEFNVTQEEVVRVSPLFDWYGEDFGDVTTYLNRYLRTNIPPKKKIYFLEYDWSLNN